MTFYCYCSKILPGKSDTVRNHWKAKAAHKSEVKSAQEIDFWKALKMVHFESWLQPSTDGDFMIHLLDGESLQLIFKGLREQIANKQPTAIKLRDFYLDVLGKDYSDPQVEPKIEKVMDISILSPSAKLVKQGFVYPLLSHKEQEHKKFREIAMGEKRSQNENMMRAFGVFRVATWIQHAGDKKFIVSYF